MNPLALSFLLAVAQPTNPITLPVHSNFHLNHHAMPDTIEDTVTLFAQFWANYNQIAPTLCLDNTFVDVHVLMGSNDNRELLWFIEPDGTILPLTLEQASAKRPYMDFSDEGWFWENTYVRTFQDELVGMYHLIEFQEIVFRTGHQFTPLENMLFHIGEGPIDFLPILIHSGFHAYTQRDLFHYDNNFGSYRYQRAAHLEERLIRRLLHRQIVDALANPDDDTYVHQVLSTFSHYQGTWLGETALDIYQGMDMEAYAIGSIATALLDRHMERHTWQALFHEHETTALHILLTLFEDVELPVFEYVFSEVEVAHVRELNASQPLSMKSFLALLTATLDLPAFETEVILSSLCEDLREQVQEAWADIEAANEAVTPLSPLLVAQMHTGMTLPLTQTILAQATGQIPALDFLPAEGYLTIGHGWAVMDYLAQQQPQPAQPFWFYVNPPVVTQE